MEQSKQEDLKKLRESIKAISSKHGEYAIDPSDKMKIAVHKPRSKQDKDLYRPSKAVKFQKIDSDLLHKALRDYLKELRYEFVLSKVYYMSSEMDMMAIVSDKLIEFEIKTDPNDFENEWKKTYVLPPIKPNKHEMLAAGGIPLTRRDRVLSIEDFSAEDISRIEAAVSELSKGKSTAEDILKRSYFRAVQNQEEQRKTFPNFYYFVVPKGMISKKDVPSHAGLIYATLSTNQITGDLKAASPSHVMFFQIEKIAPMLHTRYIQASFYKDISKKLYARYEEMLTKCNEPNIPDIQQRVAVSISIKGRK